jgi:hypothetical protein
MKILEELFPTKLLITLLLSAFITEQEKSLKVSTENIQAFIKSFMVNNYECLIRNFLYFNIFVGIFKLKEMISLFSRPR